MSMPVFDCWKFNLKQYVPVFFLDRDNYILFPASKDDFNKCFESPENFYEKLLKKNSIEKIDVKYLKVDELGYINIVENSENDKLDKKAEKELRDRIREVSQGYMRYLGEK